MNKARRKELNAQYKALEALQDRLTALTAEFNTVKDELERIRDEEQDAYDNLRESLQGSEKGQAMQDAISYIDTAIDKVGEIADIDPDLSEALEALDNAEHV